MGILLVTNESNSVSSFTCLQKLQLHVGPSHVLIRRLKISRFSAVLICSGRLFHKIIPSYLTLLGQRLFGLLWAQKDSKVVFVNASTY